MDVVFARAFVNATRRICSELLDLDTQVLAPRLMNCHAPRHYITGIINLSGDREGTISMGFDRMVAVRATEYLLGNRPSKINAQVVDAVGELTNQIAGVARQNLLPLSLTVSIPYVICGISQTISFPKGCQRISVPMTSIWGNLAIDFGFVENTTGEVKKKDSHRKESLRIDGAGSAELVMTSAETGQQNLKQHEVDSLIAAAHS